MEYRSNSEIECEIIKTEKSIYFCEQNVEDSKKDYHIEYHNSLKNKLKELKKELKNN